MAGHAVLAAHRYLGSVGAAIDDNIWSGEFQSDEFGDYYPDFDTRRGFPRTQHTDCFNPRPCARGDDGLCLPAEDDVVSIHAPRIAQGAVHNVAVCAASSSGIAGKPSPASRNSCLACSMSVIGEGTSWRIETMINGQPERSAWGHQG
jgi:hypothetical protein